jgi:cob(I)alamin adenosyltransferase
MHINRVYTKGGDRGETALIGGQRVSKASPRIACYGTIDELNATIGLCRTQLEQPGGLPDLVAILARVQNELFNLGAQLATPDAARRAQLPALAPRHVEALERELDALNGALPDLTSFVLPGGGWASAYFHLARTVCRRAERLVVELGDAGEELPALAIEYLNRLSDALFVFGRHAARASGHAEVLWTPEST